MNVNRIKKLFNLNENIFGFEYSDCNSVVKLVFHYIFLTIFAIPIVTLEIIAAFLYLLVIILGIPMELLNLIRKESMPMDEENKTDIVIYRVTYILMFVLVMPSEFFKIMYNWLCILFVALIDLCASITNLGFRKMEALKCFTKSLDDEEQKATGILVVLSAYGASIIINVVFYIVGMILIGMVNNANYYTFLIILLCIIGSIIDLVFIASLVLHYTLKGIKRDKTKKTKKVKKEKVTISKEEKQDIEVSLKNTENIIKEEEDKPIIDEKPNKSKKKMKAWVLTLIIIFSVLGLSCVGIGISRVVTNSRFSYTLVGDEYYISKYIGSNKTEIVIPAKYKGKKVVGISTSAFAYSNIEKIDLSKSNIKVIENAAFAYCENLKEIDFGDSLQKIEEYAFYDCEGLTNIVFPRSLSEIESLAFGYCTNLKDVNIYEKTNYNPASFYKNTNIHKYQ